MEIIIALCLGSFIGYIVKLNENQKKINGKLQQLGVIFLLFSMGASIGANDNIISDLPVIGVKAFTFATLTILGSIALVYFLSSKFLKGNVVSDKNEENTIAKGKFDKEVEEGK
ncbi:LysO family transporter [Clostridium tunisiense]|uniref:LysO family transporter n=1 Tax=Clostridium tunisiense TaxID=219748 RepID=UPI0002F1086C|nr:LysO family transporter [Clostridium tunisiense]